MGCGARLYKRPHSASGDRSPEEFGQDCGNRVRPLLHMAGRTHEAPASAMHCSQGANPKPLQYSFSSHPRLLNGGPEKLLTDSSEQTAANGDLVEVVS